MYSIPWLNSYSKFPLGCRHLTLLVGNRTGAHHPRKTRSANTLHYWGIPLLWRKRPVKRKREVLFLCDCMAMCDNTGRSHLRSANMCLLSVPRTRTTYDDRSFAVSGPVTWNSLPVALRSSDVTEETFRRHLKTFLFSCLNI